MAKSADAFRTISEVAEWLGSPAHVLRFWESKFTQVKPVKRAGGRRYYRPNDMLLLGGIKKLLHEDGMTIKGVQKILREQGVKYVASLSAPLEFDAQPPLEGVSETPQALADQDQVVQFQRDAEAPASRPETVMEDVGRPGTPPSESAATGAFERESHETGEPLHEEPVAQGEAEQSEVAARAPEEAPEIEPPATDLFEPGRPATDTQVLEDFAAPPSADVGEPGRPEHSAAGTEETQELETREAEAGDSGANINLFSAGAAAEPSSMPESAPTATEAEFRGETSAESSVESPEQPSAETHAEPSEEAETASDAAELPAFLHSTRSLEESLDTAQPSEPVSPQPRAIAIDLPPDPTDDGLDVPHGLLTELIAYRGRRLDHGKRDEVVVLRTRLASLHTRRTGAAPE